MPSVEKNRSRAYLLLLLNAALWGIAAPIIKYSLNFTTPSLFLFFRYCFAGLLFLPIYLLFKKHYRTKTNYKLLVALGLLGTPLTLLPLFYGLKLTTSIEASLIETSAPLFVVTGGLLFLKEKLSGKEWIGLIVASLGTLILTIEPALSSHRLTDFSLYGNLLIVLSNIVWASFLLLSKKNHVNPIDLSFFSFGISIPFFLIISLLEGQTITLNTYALPGILYMSIAGSIIAFWAYQEGQRLIEASEAVIFSYLKPAFAVPLAIFWLKESFSTIAAMATFLIIFGVFYSEKR